MDVSLQIQNWEYAEIGTAIEKCDKWRFQLGRGKVGYMDFGETIGNRELIRQFLIACVGSDQFSCMSKMSIFCCINFPLPSKSNVFVSLFSRWN